MSKAFPKGWWPTKDELQMLVDHIECLPPMVRHVMDLRYGLYRARTLTHSEIAKEFGDRFTADRIRALEHSGWNRVRAVQKKEIERCQKDASGANAGVTQRATIPTAE